jgi:hypothetical protein
LHYCNEYRAASAGATDCAQGGGTEGTGCSRSDLAGSCRQGDYESFFYGSGVVASAAETVCPDGTFRPGGGAGAGGGGGEAGASGSAGTGGGQGSCTIALSGAYTATLECSAVLMDNGTVRISSTDEVTTFQVQISEVVSMFPATLTESSLSEGAMASISVATDGANGDIWNALVNRALYEDTGTFTLVIERVTTDAIYRRDDLHGTLDATLTGNAIAGTTGTVDVHVEMP